MSFINRIKQAVASRIRSTYTYQIDKFDLEKGVVGFANWQNPMVPAKKITQEEIAFFEQFIPAGSFCIDIGANVGDTTVPMAVATGKDGLVLALDPNPYVFEILQTNAALNKSITNIVPIPYAATASDGEFYYNSSEASFGNGGVSENLANHHGKFSLDKKVTGINLLSYLTKNYGEYIGSLSFIKVDVEGHDLDVLQTIESLIKEYKPVLVAECFLKSTSQERVELYDFVADLGYVLYYFEDFDINTERIKLSRTDMSRWPNFNFYALPLSK